MTKWPEPISIEGKYISAIPLSLDHQSDLEEAAADGDLHHLWYTSIPEPGGINGEIE